MSKSNETELRYYVKDITRDIKLEYLLIHSIITPDIDIFVKLIDYIYRDNIKFDKNFYVYDEKTYTWSNYFGCNKLLELYQKLIEQLSYKTDLYFQIKNTSYLLQSQHCQIIHILSTICYDPGIKSIIENKRDTNMIILNNGTLDMNTLQFRSHRKDDFIFLTTKANFDFIFSHTDNYELLMKLLTNILGQRLTEIVSIFNQMLFGNAQNKIMMIVNVNNNQSSCFFIELLLATFNTIKTREYYMITSNMTKKLYKKYKCDDLKKTKIYL